MIRAARLAAFGIAAAAAGGLALAAPGGAARPVCAQAAGAHHASLVVEHSSGAVLTFCVGFDTATITGEQVMDLSGVEWQSVQYSFGKAVCQIDYEPRTYPPGCFTSSSPYWAMFVSRQGHGWGTSNLGVSAQTFADGDALGWHFVPSTGGAAPPLINACQAVAPPAATTPPSRPAPPAATGVPPAPESPAPAATPPEESPTISPTISPTPIPPASGRAGRPPPAGGGAGAGLSPGWVVAALTIGALAGWLLLQAVAPHIRR